MLAQRIEFLLGYRVPGRQAQNLMVGLDGLGSRGNVRRALAAQERLGTRQQGAGRLAVLKLLRQFGQGAMVRVGG